MRLILRVCLACGRYSFSNNKLIESLQIVGRSGEPIVDLSQGLIISEGKEPKPKVYNISSTYSAGATIVYQSDNPVYCGWKPLSQLPYLTFKSSSSESNQSDDSIAGVMRSVSSDNTLS